MKKVRFETPIKLIMDVTEEYECHSPRPFLEKQFVSLGCKANQARPVIFNNDPVHRFENDNSLPYPLVTKTCVDQVDNLGNKKIPSCDLELSMLDWSNPRIKIPSPKVNTVLVTEPNIIALTNTAECTPILATHKILSSIENTAIGAHPLNRRNNEFFLKKENLGKISFDPMQRQNEPSINIDNNPLRKKSELIRIGTHNMLYEKEKENYASPTVESNTDCECHHCINIISHVPHKLIQNNSREHLHRHMPRIKYDVDGKQSCCLPSTKCVCNCNMPIVQPPCNCNYSQQQQNAVDKKTWAIEKYEKTRDGKSLEVEKSNNAFKEKREPTVSDLFKIIKLQNEQLQLLQEKVDKFISTHNNEGQQSQKVPIQNYVSEQLAVQTVNSEQHKISIGVMTSFEMVRTSTVINKEIVKQSEAQIQCNRSQVSIKELVSKKQAGNLNFLEGITPVSKNVKEMNGGNIQICSNSNSNEDYDADNIIEDKTLNDLSLYNVQVDNATTPLMSPEQSLYLDIRDYSESDSGSDDQSNVGWTYYNKVMTHVNGMLQDSDMPSSASALYRHTKQRCMQIDKSNVSVGKRVTFGDDPLGIQQHHIAISTDTSLKMNQLAAKYLKNAPVSHTPSPAGEMSFATRKYMERHKLLQGQNAPIQQDIPRFLDITALKQQPKFV